MHNTGLIHSLLINITWSTLKSQLHAMTCCKCVSNQYASRQLNYIVRYYIYYAPRDRSNELAHILDSVVRVSRRVGQVVVLNSIQFTSLMHACSMHETLASARVMHSTAVLLHIAYEARKL